MRRIAAFTALLLTVAAVYFLWPKRSPIGDERGAESSPSLRTQIPDAADPRGAKGPSAKSAVRGAAPALSGGAGGLPYDEAEFPIAAPLNAPGSTVARDLDIVSQIFDAWRSNFPTEGNPVGENAEIAAALMGDNRLGLALIPKGHRAINENGELCDRWGTPLRLHQLSGTRMEVRSAGPDRKFNTDDDAVWTPQ